MWVARENKVRGRKGKLFFPPPHKASSLTHTFAFHSKIERLLPGHNIIFLVLIVFAIPWASLC